MNIHFKDENLLKQLRRNTISSNIIGSKLYKLNNENSDTDYLNIYLENNNSFYWLNHQLQYKTDNEDHNFCELKIFIRNLLSGDTTINFELIQAGVFQGDLEFLNDFKNDLVNYNILKAYVGLAKRDLKRFTSEKNLKKLAHCFRGVVFAKQLIYEGKLTLNLDTYYFNYFKNKISDREIFKNILNGDDSLKYVLKEHISELKQIINYLLEESKIKRIMDINRLKELDDYVKEIYKKNDIEEIDYGDILYDVIENGVRYWKEIKWQN